MSDLLSYARELEARDEEVAAAIAELAELEGEAVSIRVRAEELDAFAAGLPERRSELAEQRAAAHADLDQRRRALEDALAEAAEAERRGEDERLAAARRAEVRARDSLASGEARLTRAEEQTVQLEADVEAAERERPELAARAAAAAARMSKAPRVSAAAVPGDDLVDWGSRARAALYVARTGLEAERERIVREASELGTAALGEPVFGSTVAAVLRRLEERG